MRWRWPAGWRHSSRFVIGSRSHPRSIAPLQTDERAKLPLRVWLAMAIYVVAFTAMNWQLYRGLLMPHGDSAMYEEHLWNLEHGKGFRSYLDRGLFLGEHVQVIHILLIPLHLLWPSQLLLEACQSIALAVRRDSRVLDRPPTHGQHARGGTVRDGVPAVFPDAFSRHLDRPQNISAGKFWRAGTVVCARCDSSESAYATFSFLTVLAISSQEAFTFVVAPLGLWIALARQADGVVDNASSPFGDRGSWASVSPCARRLIFCSS